MGRFKGPVQAIGSRRRFQLITGAVQAMSLPQSDGQPGQPPGRGQQIVLKVFDNEPMARLSEQRLRHEDIPCLIKSLHGGPGLWGSAYNLPHALYVYEADQMTAREVLELPPQELAEREADPASSSGRARAASGGVWIIVLVIALAMGWILFQNVFLRGLQFSP